MASKLEVEELFLALGNGDPVALPSPQDMSLVAKHFGKEEKNLEYFLEEYVKRGLDEDVGMSLDSTAYYEHLRSFDLTEEDVGADFLDYVFFRSELEDLARPGWMACSTEEQQLLNELESLKSAMKAVAENLHAPFFDCTKLRLNQPRQIDLKQ